MKIFIIFVFCIPFAISTTSNYYCADFSCRDPISIGKTLLRYSGKTEKHLSFSKNDDILILSKPLHDGDDWVAFSRGKVGLVPKTMVREMKMIKYDSKYQFPFEQLPLWGTGGGINERPGDSNYIDNPNLSATASEDIPPPSKPPILEISPGTNPDSIDGSIDFNGTIPEADSEGAADEVEEPPKFQKQKKMAEPLLPDVVDEEISLEENDIESSADASNMSLEDESMHSDTLKIVTPEILPEENLTSSTASQEQKTVPAVEVKMTPDIHINRHEILDGDDGKNTPELVAASSSVEETSAQHVETQSVGLPSEVQQTESVQVEQEAENQYAQVVPSDLPDSTPVTNEVNVEENHEGNNADTDAAIGKAVNEEEIESTTASSLFQSVKQATQSVLDNLLSEDLSMDDQHKTNNNADVVSEQTESTDTVTKISDVETTVMPPQMSEIQSSAVSGESSKLPVDENNNEPTGIVEPSSHVPQDVQSTILPDLQQNSGAASLESPSSATQQEPSAQEISESEQTTVEPDRIPGLPQDADSPPDSLDEFFSQTLAAEEAEELKSPAHSQSTQEPPSPYLPQVSLEPSATESSPPTQDGADVARESEVSIEPVQESESPKVPEPQQTLDASPLTQDQMPSSVSVNVEIQPATEYLGQPADISPQVSSVPEVPLSVSDEKSTDELPPEVTESPGYSPEVPEAVTESAPEEDHHHHHGHGHSHHDHHSHTPSPDSSWSIVVVVKHLSGTLLSFLPEHLQDTILDVDSALVFTGIIALMLVSICVPYFLMESILAVRPLKKQVVELNKSLWKVSAAYENQQEEFDTYKKKALAYDEDQKRIEQLEMELQILKKLEAKQKEQVKLLQKQLKTSAKAADKIEGLIDASIRDKEIALEERNVLKTNYAKLQSTLKIKLEELEEAQASGSALALDLEVVQHEKENLTKRLSSLESELELTKLKLFSENETRRAKETTSEKLSQEKEQLSTEMTELRRILHQYEENVSTITEELTQKENELLALKESLGEDSPLIDISEAKAKLKSAEEEAATLKSRISTVTFENSSLSRTLEEAKSELTSITAQKEEAENNLKVLEGWFHKKEEELRAAVAKLEVEQSVKHKNKDDLVKMIREKESEIQILISTNDGLKQEIEDMKGSHRNDLRGAEAKADEHWLSLCQSERKTAEARKECEQLRQKLVALVKEKDGDDISDLLGGIGDVPLYLPPEIVPPPVPDDLPPMSYFSLDDDFIPPVPLDMDMRNEPRRPVPLGRLSPPSPNNNYSPFADDDPLSPIGRGGNGGGGRGDYSGDSSRSDSPDHRRPGSRDNWMNDNRSDLQGGGAAGGGGGAASRRRRANHNHNHHENGPKTSSPIPHGVNL